MRLAVLLMGLSMAMPLVLGAQRVAIAPQAAEAAPHRTRLILRDGSYQLVTSYTVANGIVHYKSAERGGATEEIPLELVDMAATRKWEKDHAAPVPGEADRPVVLSPELQREEAERAARTPEVAPNLRLPEEDSLLMLDTFQSTPELVPLAQEGSDLNKQTAHNLLRGAVNPLSSSHQLVEIKGERADVQIHVAEPVLYVRVGKDDDGEDIGGGGITVDTHGAGGRATPSTGSEKSTYVILRTDVRQGLRVVTSFRISLLGGTKRQEDVVDTDAVLLPGGRWLKVTPRQPLEFGEYAVMEVLGPKDVNLSVWDFGVHPNAPENADAIHPEEKRPASLERRRP